ncbi:MAG TPA: sulfatase-like hydrolase/transferase, partial [Polyangiaceae bacterium]|nr:sulfatase-like hydrolase/transferase [Polyangiaceae bacterium]
VVVTSDHGENLYEDGHGQGHGDHLFGDQGTHVPLVIYDPRVAAPHAEQAVVETVDLAPTLCDLVGAAPPAGMDGRSLAAGVRGAPVASQPAYAETELWLLDDMSVLRSLRVPTPGVLDLLEIDTEHGQEIITKAATEPLTLLARHRMVRDDRWKLVYAPTTKGVVYELFDTREDPDERVDLAAAMPDETARLKELLWRWMLADGGVRRVGDYVVPRGFELEQLLPGGGR